MAVGDDAGFSVTSQALVSAGWAAEAASEQVSSSTQIKLSGATPQVISGHPGWQSSAALQACLEAWETRLRQLSAEIQHISQNLNATVDGYGKAQAQTLADIRQAAASLDAETG